MLYAKWKYAFCSSVWTLLMKNDGILGGTKYLFIRVVFFIRLKLPFLHRYLHVQVAHNPNNVFSYSRYSFRIVIIIWTNLNMLSIFSVYFSFSRAKLSSTKKTTEVYHKSRNANNVNFLCVWVALAHTQWYFSWAVIIWIVF